MGCGKGVAMSLAVRKIEEPMIPLTSSRTESSNDRPRISDGCELCLEGFSAGADCDAIGVLIGYPIPSSSGDSSGVPHVLQMTAEQSPHVSGSVTSLAQFGQYNRSRPGRVGGAGSFCAMRDAKCS